MPGAAVALDSAVAPKADADCLYFSLIPGKFK
jgi:hypothetical protein